jgi:hypothetical protein
MAQIISNVDFGFHNRDLQVANARLSAEGSWKKQRIAWIIPAGESINSKVYVAHRGLIFPPNQAMAPLLIEGAEVGAAFDVGIQMILNHPDLSTWEYVLSIEHDNIPEPTGVMKLLRAMEANPQFDAISGLYWTKGEGGVPQIWGTSTIRSRTSALRCRSLARSSNAGASAWASACTACPCSRACVRRRSRCLGSRPLAFRKATTEWAPRISSSGDASLARMAIAVPWTATRSSGTWIFGQEFLGSTHSQHGPGELKWQRRKRSRKWSSRRQSRCC